MALITEKNTDSKTKWLSIGYQHFALYGPDQMSINQISKEINASRTSFYHHFGDIEIFVEDLLRMHLIAIEKFIDAGKVRCKQLYPDLFDLLTEYPTELKFNIQLFHNRNNPTFNFLFYKGYEIVAHAFVLKLFKDQFSFSKSDKDIFELWLTLGETWYSRITPNDLSSSTLLQHSQEIMQSILKFVESDLYSTLKRSM
jgi:AcrR family transcriptional regulator